MKWCLFVLLIGTVVIGSIHSNPIEIEAPQFNQSQLNFFDECVRVSGDKEIVPQIQKLSLEYETCEVGTFSPFMDTIMSYMEGKSDVDIENFLERQCPHMKNGFECTTKFVEDASACYEKENYDLMKRQITEMDKMIDGLCENGGERVKAAKEAKIFDCIEKFRTPVAMCLYVDGEYGPILGPVISYQPMKIPSLIVCGIPEKKQCIVNSTSSCTGGAVIGEMIDLITPFLRTACPA